MPRITLRVLHGADRGRVFDDLPTPVTIGREEGNSIQLNDDRISRFHLKLQADNDRIVATDLESTNGTKVNGEDIQVRIIRDGDMIALGRSLLLVGSPADIERRIAAVADESAAGSPVRGSDMRERLRNIASHDSDVVDDLAEVRSPLLRAAQPPLPARLSPAQAAETCELLEWIQGVLRGASESATLRPNTDRVDLGFAEWQALLDLQARLADLLRQIGTPASD
ncbi:MAG: FHA domain-containing protein [Planctomycetia bacterium]|jgi:hypothetical protein